MAKITRTKQEIFANQAGSRQVTAFGTAKNETPSFTTDLTQIQNTNYLYGWSTALLPDKAPYEEDMNALFYAVTKQLAYLFQEGIPEYDPNTEYSLNSFVKGVGTNVIYCSKVSENLGNPLSNPDYWAVYNTGGGLATYEIGLPQPTLSNNLLPNEIWLEGQAVSRIAYKKLFDIYGTTYGTGDGSTTFNLPDCRNRVFWGATNFGYISAGLPNITGAGMFWYTGNSQASRDKLEGAIFVDMTRANNYRDVDDGATGTNGFPLSFDASLSNSTYGNSSTVQPPAIKARFKTRFE